MKVLTEKGSKQRFLEMMERVNKIKINENIMDGTSIPVVFTAFENLKNEKINIGNTKVTSEGNESYVEIDGNDAAGNNVLFKFKIEATDGDQEGVYNVDNAILTYFRLIKNGDQQSNFEFDETSDELSRFNQNFKGQIMDVVGKYANFEDDTPSELDEEYMDAINTIDSVKPRNDIRENQPELGNSVDYGSHLYNRISGVDKEKYVLEARQLIIAYFKRKGLDFNSISKKSQYDAIKAVAIRLYTEEASKMNEDEKKYPNEIGKKFKAKDNYPKNTKKRDVTVKIDEDTSGEVLVGGLGDGKSPSDFDKEQVTKGIGVEMEHSSDPKIALEIVLDHLTEDPQYYTVKDDPETSAQFNASMDAEENSDKPHESGAYLQDGMAGEKDRNGHSIPAVDPHFMMNKSAYDNWIELNNVENNPENPYNDMKRTFKQNPDQEQEDVLLGYKPKNIGDAV